MSMKEYWPTAPETASKPPSCAMASGVAAETASTSLRAETQVLDTHTEEPDMDEG